MKCYKQQTFILKLDNEEANWIKDNMQNPLHGEAFEAESSYDKQMRNTIFNALTNARIRKD